MIADIFDRFYATYRYNKETYKPPLKQELIDILIDLAKMYSPSGQEKDVIEYCAKFLGECGFTVIIDNIGNIVAERGISSPDNKVVCINAHTDTVQRETDKIISSVVFYDVFSDTVQTRERAMVGGDDKCGLAVGLTLAKYTDLPMRLIFNTGEEIGGVGMEALDPKYMENLAFTLTVDRMNGTDLISEYCGLVCAPEVFVDKFIELSKNVGVKYVDTFGSYADTYVICKYAPAVNLSAGYYNPHTRKDYVKMNELYNTMRAVRNAIEHKQELLDAIALAPEGWQVDSYGAYSGGRYGAYSGMGGIGGYEDGYGYVNKGRNRKQRRGSRGMGQCHLTYGESRGFDDKSRVKYGSPNPDPDAKYTEDELIEAYASNKISDDDWDEMYGTHAISQDTYIVGIDELLYREKLREGGLTEDDLPESSGWKEVPENEYYNSMEVDFGNDTDGVHYEDLGYLSGYLPDTTEDDVFRGYMEGEITYPELDELYREFTIPKRFLDHCVKSRQEFLVQALVKKPHTKPKLIIKPTKYEKQREINAANRTPHEWMGILRKKDYSEGDWYKLFHGGFINAETYEMGLDYIDDRAFGKKPNTFGIKEDVDIEDVDIDDVDIDDNDPPDVDISWRYDTASWTPLFLLGKVSAGEIDISEWDSMHEKDMIDDITHYRGLTHFDPSTLTNKRLIEDDTADYHLQWVRAGGYTLEVWDDMFSNGIIDDKTYKKGLKHFKLKQPYPQPHPALGLLEDNKRDDDNWRKLNDLVKSEIDKSRNKTVIFSKKYNHHSCGVDNCDPTHDTDDCKGC